MHAAYLRALQAEILGREDCANLRVLNEPKWLVPPVVEINYDTGELEVTDPGKANPAWLPGDEVVARDLAIAGILNEAKWGATSREVQCHLAKKLLLVRGRWRGIVMAAQSADHPAVDSAFVAVELGNDPNMTADFCAPAAAALMQPLIDAGLLDAEDVAALQALCLVPSAVTADHVSRALRGPWGDEA